MAATRAGQHLTERSVKGRCESLATSHRRALTEMPVCPPVFIAHRGALTAQRNSPLGDPLTDSGSTTLG